MICVISPAKDLNYKDNTPFFSSDTPRLWDKSWQLIELLKKKKSKDLIELMDISQKLADENVLRYQNFTYEFNEGNSKPAFFAFDGDVYRGLDAKNLTKAQITHGQKHVRILSGLYGLLRPLDLMQAYRLEMGTSLKVQRKKNLVDFWGDDISLLLKEDLIQTKSKALVNLASQEYFEAVRPQLLGVPVVHIHFRENHQGKIKFLSYNAKRARGLMTRYICIEKIKEWEKLKDFNFENYRWSEELSKGNELFFVKQS